MKYITLWLSIFVVIIVLPLYSMEQKLNIKDIEKICAQTPEQLCTKYYMLHLTNYVRDIGTFIQEAQDEARTEDVKKGKAAKQKIRDAIHHSIYS